MATHTLNHVFQFTTEPRNRYEVEYVITWAIQNLCFYRFSVLHSFDNRFFFKALMSKKDYSWKELVAI